MIRPSGDGALRPRVGPCREAPQHLAVDVPQQGARLREVTDRHDAVRWIPARNWHITLAFLGELTTAQRLRTQVALGMAARASAPCDLTLDGTLGRFGDRVLWARVVHDDALTALAAAVRDAGGRVVVDAGRGGARRGLRRHGARRAQGEPRPAPSLTSGAPSR